jgi:hypothetical protein
VNTTRTAAAPPLIQPNSNRGAVNVTSLSREVPGVRTVLQGEAVGRPVPRRTAISTSALDQSQQMATERAVAIILNNEKTLMLKCTAIENEVHRVLATSQEKDARIAALEDQTGELWERLDVHEQRVNEMRERHKRPRTE